MKERYITERVIVRLIRAHWNDHCQACHINDDLLTVNMGKERVAGMCCGIYARLKEWRGQRASKARDT